MDVVKGKIQLIIGHGPLWNKMFATTLTTLFKQMLIIRCKVQKRNRKLIVLRSQIVSKRPFSKMRNRSKIYVKSKVSE